MFGRMKRAAAEAMTKLAALDRSQAVIEFDRDGTILTANANFLAAVGYDLSEIEGRHHDLFVEPAYRASAAYAEFWATLRRGEFHAGQFKRIAKDGREIWIEATYNPIRDRAGKLHKVIKFATDVTRQRLEDADRKGQIDAIRKSQAVITFDLDGRVLDANDNFLRAVGYAMAEIAGRHHSLFVDPALKASPDYAEFWSRLRRGEYQAGQYRRLGKGGREIWIEASYNPILDAGGRPYKVVKFATDITAQVRLLGEFRRLIEQNFGEIEGAVGRTTREAGGAGEAAGATSQAVQTMAAAAEELAASVTEISETMAKARFVIDRTHQQVHSASGVTRSLSTATIAMSGIVGLIQTIANQINLLALNATIESARAGAAGRGFAVVAQEVKSLANQASQATAQISAEIGNVQAISEQVVTSLEAIQHSFGTMLEHVTSTATAVEEQSAVTRDLSANMQSAAGAVTLIAENMRVISGSVAGISEAVATTKTAARILTR
ncbi:methyl-accepting chemotaxis protein [Methylobacterium sp. ID0610]|uniref:methyl-accepting chemotaxis protein n=1 Tax=Methylobacterium carpenticola TaxID=3344827 RepID=UPI003692FF54